MVDRKTDARKGESGVLSCGLIMPISGIDGCPPEHWSDVKTIIVDAVENIADPKFKVKLVSDADDVGIIQKRIVQNIYSSDVVVCDVSGKNPNVMFELGMRLAFDKPTVIVKDDKTDYSFDTGIIEHVGYPRDLRHPKMVTFKAVLAEKVCASHRASKADPEHSTFLKSFGKFQVASLSQDVVPAEKLILEMLNDVQLEIARLRSLTAGAINEGRKSRDYFADFQVGRSRIDEEIKTIARLYGDSQSDQERELTVGGGKQRGVGILPDDLGRPDR